MAKKYKLTPEHEAQLPAWRDRWIANAMSTEAMTEADREVCRGAVEELYRAADLIPPPRERIVFVPSPIVAKFAGGFASWIWHRRGVGAATDVGTHDATRIAIDNGTTAATRAVIDASTHATTATYVAIDDATHAAVADATEAATYDATRDATYAATHAAVADATYVAIDAATHAATRDAREALGEWYVINADMWELAARLGVGIEGLKCAGRMSYQGGNFWSADDGYLTFFRHIVKLPIDYMKWAPWETLSLHSSWRIVHKEFCIISDRPERLMVDDRNRPHSATGPFCRWRDGVALYAWHGTYVPAWWIERRSELTPAIALREQNMERRRAACEIIGWERILHELHARLVDRDEDPAIGELLEVELPDSGRQRFLRAQCGTGRQVVMPVPRTMRTALEANAATYGIPTDFLRQKEHRT